MFNKTKKTLGVALASVGLVGAALSNVPVANADTGGSYGTGKCMKSGCSIYGPFYWRFTSSDANSSAWQKFAANSPNEFGASGWPNMNVEYMIKNYIPAIGMTNNQLLTACKNSKMIWWISGGNPTTRGKDNAWTHNYGGTTYPGVPRQNTFLTAQSAQGSQVIPETQSSVKAWADSLNVSNLTLICSDVADGHPAPPPPKVSKWTETRTVAGQGGSEKTWTKPYNYNTMITRQISKNGKDPIGKDNLHDQASFQKTSFAALWDDMQKNPTKYKNMKPTDIEKLVDQALNNDKNAKHSVLDLDKANKDGMAEGGVLNVSELVKNATISSKETISNEQQRSCSTTTSSTFDSKANKWIEGAPQTICSDWKTTKTNSSISLTTNIDATPKQTGFWQMLSVHCNKDQFNALTKAAQGSKVVNTGDSTKGISAVAYSKKYATQPATLDFGDANNANKALSASSKLSFYDKECPFDCTASPTGPGASSDNGANSNITNKKPNGGTIGKYGAVSGKNNDNTFTFFRDNVKHNIKVDVWYPTSKGVIKYNGKAPLTSTINRWADGTPSLDGSDGGKFSMFANNSPLFTGSDSLPSLADWSSKAYSNPTSTTVKGLARSFDAQATWSSQKDKPQKFNVKWEYAPDVSTKFMTDAVGFDKDSNVIGTESDQTAEIEGVCYAMFGTPTGLDTSKMFGDNTGSDSTNTLDTQLLPNDNAQLIINFVRSTTE